MAMVDTDVEAAKKIVGTSNSVTEFRQQVEASTIKWWQADNKQKQILVKVATDSTLIPEPNKAEVKVWIDAYCRKVSMTQAFPYIAEKIGSTGETSRGHWLMYYLQECTIAPEKMTAAGRTLVEDALNELLCVTARDGKVRPQELAVKGGAVNSIDAGKFCNILARLLEAGFARFPGTPEQFKKDDTSHPDLLKYLHVVDGKKHDEYGWRSDSRTYDEIIAAKGFLPKAQTEGYAKTHGMREPWHPYHDTTARSYMRFRNGQNDNCLYSVVSIGEPGGDWPGYLSFPLLKDHKSWAVTDQEVPCLVNDVHTKQTFGVSFTWLYLYVMDGLLIANTNAIQTAMGEGKFPELGTPGIPLENLYGAIKFIRLHRAAKADATDDQGFSTRPIDSFPAGKYKPVTDQWSATERAKLEKLFRTVAQSTPRHLRWTPAGYEQVSETFTVANKQVKFHERSYLHFQ